MEFILGFDTFVLSALEAIRTTQLTGVFVSVTLFGSKITIAILTLVCSIWLYRKGEYRLALLCILFNTINGLVTWILKLLIHRPRPDTVESLIEASGFSLPSGHASSSLLFYGMIAFLLLRTLRSPQARFALILSTVLFILCIGVSRLYLGVHYPTDVLIGFAIGGLMLCLFIWLAPEQKRDNNHGVK